MSMPSDNSMKIISATDDELRIANYIVLFGGRDLAWVDKGENPDGSKGEFFTENTTLESSYTKTGVLHMDWEHGYGEVFDGKDSPGRHDVLGFVDWKTAKKDKRGWWVERVLSRRNDYVRMLEELIRVGMIGSSSEAVPGKVVRGKDGEIKAWPLRRDTLTVQPAEPRMITENVITALKSLSEKFPEIRIPGITKNPQTLAEKTAELTQELSQLLNDVRELVKTIDRPLSETKRQELTELLELCSGLDAVRSDLSSVLAAAPTKPGSVSAKLTRFQLAEARKRMAHILKE